MNRAWLWPWTHHVLNQALNIWYGRLHFKFTVPLEKLTTKFWGRYECIQHWWRKKKGCEGRGAAADSLQALLKWEKILSAKNWCFNFVPFILQEESGPSYRELCQIRGEGWRIPEPRYNVSQLSLTACHGRRRLRRLSEVTSWNWGMQLMQISWPHIFWRTSRLQELNCFCLAPLSQIQQLRCKTLAFIQIFATLAVT